MTTGARRHPDRRRDAIDGVVSFLVEVGIVVTLAAAAVLVAVIVLAAT